MIKQPNRKHARRKNSNSKNSNLSTHPPSNSFPSNGCPLTASVLVLNRFYLPVHVISARRAIVMLYRDLGEVIHVENGQYFNYDFGAWLETSEFLAADEEVDMTHREFVRSVNFNMEVPRVLRLYTYEKVPQQTLRFNRRSLFARDDHQCQYCSKQFPFSQLSFDHVVPRSRGGDTTWENVVCSCLRCNSRKSNRTPEEAGMKLVRKPIKPKQNPLLVFKLDNPKYESWRSFLNVNNR